MIYPLPQQWLGDLLANLDVIRILSVIYNAPIQKHWKWIHQNKSKNWLKKKIKLKLYF